MSRYATITWYMTIGYGVYLALSTENQLADPAARDRHLRYNHFIVWVPAFLLAFCPIFGNGYAPVNDKSLCWFSPEYPLLRLINLIPLSCYLLFSLFLILFTYCRLRSFEVAATR